MKKIKFIIRLLIFIPIFSYFLSLIFNESVFLNGFDPFLFTFDNEFWTEYSIIMYTMSGPFVPFIEIIQSTFNIGYIMPILTGICAYQLYCSLVFLCFDLFNLPLAFGAKFFNKGSDL